MGINERGIGIMKITLVSLKEHKTIDGVYENIENIKGKLKNFPEEM